jgi:hypothetical protein
MIKGRRCLLQLKGMPSNGATGDRPRRMSARESDGLAGPQRMMVGHVAETGVVIGHEFREGSAAPAAGNLEFLQVCEANMPKDKRVEAIRADSAASGGDLQLV